MWLQSAATPQVPHKLRERTHPALKFVPGPSVGESVASSPCLFIVVIKLKDKFTFSVWTLYKIILSSDFHLSPTFSLLLL